MSFSLDSIWNSLTDGDPGPAQALVDALLDNDMAFAAGGFLRDLAERLSDVGEVMEDDEQREKFVLAIHEVLPVSHDHDESAVAELLIECGVNP